MKVPSLKRRDDRMPMKLSLVFLFGFLASLAVLGGLMWLFAAYETRSIFPFTHRPLLSQDKWFEIIRNAVTTAAALGIGVTLFFSYRRQQTAEETQRIGSEAQLTAAKAQKTAAEALELSNRQHALDQERRKDAVTSELRGRYAQAAEQLGSERLSVRLAGVYSLAALADDWAEIGNMDERQVCIDLLGACLRSTQAGEDLAARKEVITAVLDVVKARLRADSPERKYWGRSAVALRNLAEMPSFKGLVLREQGSFHLSAAKAVLSSVNLIEMYSGRLVLEVGKNNESEFLGINNARLLDGWMSVRVGGNRSKTPGTSPKELHISGLELMGARFVVSAEDWAVSFHGCTFESGEISAVAHFGSISFRECIFKGDVFGASGPRRAIQADAVVLEGCRFENDAPELKPYQSQPVSHT